MNEEGLEFFEGLKATIWPKSITFKNSGQSSREKKINGSRHKKDQSFSRFHRVADFWVFSAAMFTKKPNNFHQIFLPARRVYKIQIALSEKLSLTADIFLV